MANNSVDIIRLALSRNAGGEFSFTAVMTAPDGSEFVVPLSEDDLLSYRSFQRTVLRKSGWMYRTTLCDGRPDEAADEAWRNGIVHLIEQPRPAAAEPSTN